jgi:hypothetical protein
LILRSGFRHAERLNLDMIPKLLISFDVVLLARLR